jgi:hypothetical protein
MSAVSGSDATRPSISGVRLTYDDLVHLPDDGKRHELIRGEHVVSASPNLRPQQIAVKLTGLLWIHLRSR